MIEAIFMMGGLGVLVGAGLAVASKVFYVYVDPRVEAVEGVLPGANCGGCGLPGCSSNAEAIVAGRATPNSCVAAGDDVAAAIASVLGVALEVKEPDIARPGCYFGLGDADTKFHYNGVSDCRAAAMLNGGMKVCTIGCLGLGSCARACPFDAIVMGPEKLPVVDPEKCTGCGTCERVCPKHIISLSSVTRRILREYTTDECTTPCQRRCPAGINIREYIRQITLGDYHRSVQVIKERNPFPTVIGRICPRPCEDDCRRQFVDEPVGINYLKRFAADYERESGKRIQPYKAPRTGKKIAVVGGGVQGLSTAFFSARLGHDATVYEATDRLGGLLRTAITKDRLPLDILDWDIEGIKEMGVAAKTGVTLGKEMDLPGLLSEGYDAVFLATGGWDSRLTRMSGEDIEQPVPGMYLLLDLIKSDTGRSNKLGCDKDVVIAGGGKYGLKAAQICLDLGAENVTVLYRETPDALIKEKADLDAVEKAGARIVFGADVSALYGEEKKMTRVEYVDLISGKKSTVAAGNLFFAAGRFPELIFFKDLDAIQTETSADTAATAATASGLIYWKAIEPYKKPEFREDAGMLSRGSEMTDFSAAIRAIGAGRRGAASIHEVMYGIDLTLPENVVRPSMIYQDVDHLENVEKAPRQVMPVCAGKERITCKELEKGYTEQMARKEAARCLQCGLICYERPSVPEGRSGHTLESTTPPATSAA